MNLDELTRLEREATPGPWVNDSEGYVHQEQLDVLLIEALYHDADAALIAAARNALPALIECAEALAVAKEFAEFWIEQSRPAKTQSAVEAPGDYSERWSLWLAIGHQSKSMKKIDAALAALKEAGNG